MTGASVEGFVATGERLPAAQIQVLFREHYLALVRLAVQLVDDRDTAEDVVQDVFAAVQARPRRMEDPAAYLRVAVVNRSRSVLRRRRTVRLFRPGREEVVEPADQGSLRRDERARVMAAIRRLPPRQREVIVLRHYEQLSVGEIAAVLGISPGATSSSLNRAMNTLTTLLGGEDV